MVCLICTIPTYLNTKFYSPGLSGFEIIHDLDFNEQLDGRTDEHMKREMKMTCIIYTLLPIHVPSFRYKHYNMIQI